MTPDFQILAGGLDVTAKMNDRLVELCVTDNDGTKADDVTIKLDDRDFRLEKPRKGTLLLVKMGYKETGLSVMGVFKVNNTKRGFTKREGRFLNITGKSADLKESMKSQRTGQYDNKPLSGIVGEAAGRHGLGAVVSPKLGAIMYKHEPQTEESDLHFLTRLAREHDAIFKVAGGKVLFMGRDELPGNIVKLKLTDFEECEAEEDDRSSHKECNAHWRDRGKGKRVKENRAGGEGGDFTLRHNYATKELAKAAAEGKKKALARKEKTLNATLYGRTDLMAGTRIQTAIGADPYDGLWFVTQAAHRITKREGYRTTITADTAEGGKGGQ